MASMIPMRPKNGKYNLLQEEMDGLSYYVISGCKREFAFLKFIRPDFIGSKSSAAVSSSVTQFFATKDVRDYIDAYKKTIEDLLSDKVKPKETKKTIGTIEERKSRALSKLVDFVLSEAEKIGEPDEDGTGTDPKSIMEFANKIGLFDQDEQTEEQPRRYLPVTCGECEYRKFVEENCERVDEGTDFEAKNN